MVINSININKKNNYLSSELNSLNTNIPTTYDVGNPDPGLGQAHTYGGVKPFNGIPTLPYVSPNTIHTVCLPIVWLNTLPEYLMSPMVFSGVRIAQSIVFCDMLWLSFNVLLSLGYCIICFRILATIFRHFVLLLLVIVFCLYVFVLRLLIAPFWHLQTCHKITQSAKHQRIIPVSHLRSIKSFRQNMISIITVC